MKKVIVGIVFIACFFTIVGLSAAYDRKHDRDKGDRYADKERQGNDEDIKRAQGDEVGQMAVHDQGSLQDDNRGRW